MVVEEDGVGVHFLFLDSRNKTFLRTAIDSISYWDSLLCVCRVVPMGSYFNMLIMGAVLGRLKV